MFRKKQWLFFIVLFFLFGSGINEDAREKALSTDLFLAIEQKNSDTAIDLLSYGADINARDEDGYTPLMYGVAVNDVRIVKQLILRGADVALKSRSGKTAFDYAKKLKRKSILMVLGRTGKQEKLQMRVDEKIRDIKDEINKNILSDINKNLSTTKNWKKKQQLLKLKTEIKKLVAFEDKLKKMEDENPAYAQRNSKHRRAIEAQKRKIKVTMDTIKNYMKMQKQIEAQKILARVKKLEALKKRLATERKLKRESSLKDIDRETEKVLSSVKKHNRMKGVNSIQRLLSAIPSKYDRQRFLGFYKRGTGKVLATGRVTPDMVINSAKRYLGRKYVFGGLDCSSLIQQAFKTHGITMPRNAESQARYGTVVADKRWLRKGDLLFFTRTYKTYFFISHIAIYMGNNRMIHSASAGVHITKFPIPGYWWKKYYVFATRVF